MAYCTVTVTPVNIQMTPGGTSGDPIILTCCQNDFGSISISTTANVGCSLFPMMGDGCIVPAPSISIDVLNGDEIDFNIVTEADADEPDTGFTFTSIVRDGTVTLDPKTMTPHVSCGFQGTFTWNWAMDGLFEADYRITFSFGGTAVTRDFKVTKNCNLSIVPNSLTTNAGTVGWLQDPNPPNEWYPFDEVTTSIQVQCRHEEPSEVYLTDNRYKCCFLATAKLYKYENNIWNYLQTFTENDVYTIDCDTTSTHTIYHSIVDASGQSLEGGSYRIQIQFHCDLQDTLAPTGDLIATALTHFDIP